MTMPTESHPSSTMPPDTAAPPPTETSNFKIAGQIRTAMAQERRLKNANVTVNVTDDRVMLAGHVSDNDDRYLALRIASDYAFPRSLVDKLRIGKEQ
jgi:osmotically-inducible protein OsmY